MSYSRKQFDKKKLKKLAHDTCNGWKGGAYYSCYLGHYVRYWKSHGHTSRYTFYKKYYHKRMRRFALKNGWYSKKEFDLIWTCW